jgi:hypothetical protein
MIGQKFIKNFGKAKFSGTLSGFSVKASGTFAVKACAVAGELDKATSSSNYDIALYTGPGLDGNYSSVLSFFNRTKGWSTLGTGATATRRVFQKGNMSHYFLDPYTDLSQIKHKAGLHLMSDRFFTISLPKLPKANNLMKVISKTRTSRISSSKNILMFEKIGSTSLFASAQKQVSGRAVTYRNKSEGKNSFYRAGKYKDGKGEFTWIGFKGPRTSILYRIEVLTTAKSSKTTDKQRQLIRQLACAAKLDKLSLDCN